MPSTYTDALRLVLQAAGENDATWGDKANTVFQMVEQAIAGRAAITHDDSASYTLTTANSASDEARNMILNIAGTLTAARNTVVPTKNKIYVAKNATTGGFATTVKTAAGTGITIPNGKTTLLAVDGTNVVNAIDYLDSLTVQDSTFKIADNADPTKIAQFQASGISTGTTRTYTLPDASTTVVGTDATQTLSNKTFSDTVTGAFFSPTSTGANGLGLAGANNPALYASSTKVIDWTSTGASITGTMTVSGTTRLAISGNAMGGAGQTNIGLYLREDATIPSSAGKSWGIRSRLLSDSSATAMYSFDGNINVANGATVGTAIVYRASGIGFTGTGNIGGGGYMGFSSANTDPTGAGGTICGFHTDMSSSGGGTKWAYYHTGTANSAFNGNVRIGSTSAPTVALDITGAALISSTLGVTGAATFTSTATAASFIPTTTTTNGLGLAGANNPALYASSTKVIDWTSAGASVTGTLAVSGATTISGALRVNSTIGINVAAVTNAALYVNETVAIPSSGAGAYGLRALLLSDTSATGAMIAVQARIYSPNSVFTTTDAINYFASAPSKGASHTITNWYGVKIDDTSAATNDYGVYSALNSGSGKWFLYGAGTAASHLGGALNAAGDFTVATNKFTVASATGNTAVAGTLTVTSDVVGGNATASTSRTTGFVYASVVSGTPTGTPTGGPFANGSGAIAFDYNNGVLWIYNHTLAGWNFVTLS